MKWVEVRFRIQVADFFGVPEGIPFADRLTTFVGQDPARMGSTGGVIILDVKEPGPVVFGLGGDGAK